MNQKLTRVGIAVPAFLVLVLSTQMLGGPLPSHREPDALVAAVDKLFAQWDKPDSPGCALAVIKDGQTIHKRGYGMANLDHGIPISPKSVFNIGSVSKQFTAMSIALLAKQGKLSLDDDIRKYLPAFPLYQSPITIRNLLYQTSGIREYSHLMLAAGTRSQDASDDDVLRILMRQRELNFKPGDEYLYSNSNYFLLAQIVTRVGGKPFPEFAADNIFKPLGMTNTHFHPDGTGVIKNRATGYTARQDSGYSAERVGSYHVGQGGLFTTIDDLFLWDQNFYDNKLGGGTQLIQQLLTPGTLNGGRKSDYAFGLDVEPYKGLKMFGHGGVTYGFNAALIQFPEKRFSAICLCNLTSIQSSGLVRQIADIYLANAFRQTDETRNNIVLPEPKVVQVPEKELAVVAGSYFSSTNNNFRRLYVKNGKLVYSRGTSESELAPLGNNRFLMLGTPDRVEITFKSRLPGAPLQMITVVNGELAFTHDSVKSATYTMQQLTELTGAYYSDEIEATYDIILRGDKFVLRRKNVDGETPLITQFSDAFSAAGTGSILFTRNRQNRVTGFLLNTGRVRRLRFDKRVRRPVRVRPGE
jgi:CubicO group peptidase (beta-lactamase class C family)